MGKAQKKTGKGRLDKYYKLAKEQGYRARSAFKLIQLNKKFAFLESSRCTIDLCAAPGGWLQVASKYMPTNSIIVGVDLVPIKPIPRVVTFAADITSSSCRNLIRGELKDWKADVVLHDGAPNVGTAWIQDAYSQSELVLMSLKLAVEFLIKGGTFVTKVFRSVDYNNLVWVFNQLFGKVEATKPPSSRNVSAEIFVVCRDFLAPRHIDPKFLDPRHVFKDVHSATSHPNGSSATNVQANVLHPEKKRRKRDGYADGEYTLFKTAGAADFVRGIDPVGILGTVNKISFTTEEERGWLNFDITSSDVKANCDDLKVLGKGDFRTLIKWRLALRQELGLDVKVKNTEDVTEIVQIDEAIDEEQQISEELERLNAEAIARVKRERRRANEIKSRTVQRMQLQMTAPLDIGLEQQDYALDLGQDDVFDLGQAEEGIRNSRGIDFFSNDNAGIMDDSDDGGMDETVEQAEEVLDITEETERKVDSLEKELDSLYESYRDRLRNRDAKFKVKESRKDNEKEEWGGINRKGTEDDDDESSEEGGWDEMEQAKNNFDLYETSDDEMEDIGQHVTKDGSTRSILRKRTLPDNLDERDTKRLRLLTNLEKLKSKAEYSKQHELWFDQEVFAVANGLDDIEVDDREDDNDSVNGTHEVGEGDVILKEDDNDFEVVPQDADSDVDMWDADQENEDEVKQAAIQKFGLVTPEAVTLAHQLVNHKISKTRLINDGFNRYSLNSKDGLPSWFIDEEAKYYKPNLPITKEAILALRAKQRAMDARPIKKVAEAKARKKFKAAQRLEKAMKKAEGVNASSDMSEREKAQQIEKLMRKGLASNKKKGEVKVVVAKGAHKGLKGRPKGVKGRYTMVDARMKKEVRAKKRKEKATQRRK